MLGSRHTTIFPLFPVEGFPVEGRSLISPRSQRSNLGKTQLSPPLLPRGESPPTRRARELPSWTSVHHLSVTRLTTKGSKCGERHASATGFREGATKVLNQSGGESGVEKGN